MNLALRQVLKRQSFRLSDKISYKYLQAPVTSSCPLNTVVYSRNYCDNRADQRRLPQLMEFPPIVWPSVLKFIKNWMYVNFIIRPYFEQEFSLNSFIEASKHAVEVVSESLQNSDFKKLDGLVDGEALAALKTAVSKLSVSQRQLLAVNKEDIFYAFPYQVGVIFDDADKRWVEITMCYHVMKGLKQMKESDDLPPISLGFLEMLLSSIVVAITGALMRLEGLKIYCTNLFYSVQPEFQDKIFILNYRFIREFTKGVEDSWWINIVNHFQPQSVANRL